MGKMLLIVAAGCVIGVSMGILVCSIGKFSEGIKVGIMLGISMTTSVLAGLVNVQIKLFIMCAVILAVSFVVVRRERYDSI